MMNMTVNINKNHEKNQVQLCAIVCVFNKLLSNSELSQNGTKKKLNRALFSGRVAMLRTSLRFNNLYNN